MRCRAVLSSCSCSSEARLFERPKNYPSLVLSSAAFPSAFPPTPFPASSPTLSRNPVSRSFQTDVALRLSAREATTTAYNIPCRATASAFARCHVKSFSLGAKDVLHVPCFRVYPNERGMNDDTFPIKSPLERRARGGKRRYVLTAESRQSRKK